MALIRITTIGSVLHGKLRGTQARLLTSLSCPLNLSSCCKESSESFKGFSFSPAIFSVSEVGIGGAERTMRMRKATRSFRTIQFPLKMARYVSQHYSVVKRYTRHLSNPGLHYYIAFMYAYKGSTFHLSSVPSRGCPRLRQGSVLVLILLSVYLFHKQVIPVPRELSGGSPLALSPAIQGLETRTNSSTHVNRSVDTEPHHMNIGLQLDQQTQRVSDKDTGTPAKTSTVLDHTRDSRTDTLRKKTNSSMDSAIIQVSRLHTAAFTQPMVPSVSPTNGQFISGYSGGVSTPTAVSIGYESGKREPSHGAKDHCAVSEVKSWRTGVVTELKPRIEVNCEQMISNNRSEIKRVKKAIKEWEGSETEEEWIQSLNDCEAVVRDFSDNFYNSPEEQAFPLAYIFVVYTNPRQIVRLIKALWRPQNLFCVHPDAKQSEEFIGVFRQLSKCLHNVFLPSKLEKVYYEHHSIMDSQLNCYEDLLHYSPDRWRYIINLCGRELPLRTNREIVKILKRLNGTNAIGGARVPPKGFVMRDRFTRKAVVNYVSGKVHLTQRRLQPPPIPVYKTYNFVAVTRPFANFFLYNDTAIRFRNYLKDVKMPEEEFYASLIHLPGVPGGKPPEVPLIDKYIWMGRNGRARSSQESCEGRTVHSICVVTVGDLDQIYQWGVRRQVPAFFFNKYFMEEDHVVMDCMEEHLIQQNKKEHLEDCKPIR